MSEPFARFDAFDGRGRSWELRSPLAVVEAWRREEVPEALARVEEAVAGGAVAGGYVAYEAAEALDATLVCRAPRKDLPLLWFGLFRERHETTPPPAPRTPAAAALHPWSATLSTEEYTRRVNRIHEWIASGDTYQVNLTFPLRSTLSPDVTDTELYASLGRSQRAGFCALLRLPTHSILSISPELFFHRVGDDLELRPMKGTRPRGRWLQEDRHRARELVLSEKERAENLMIVDLLRNDAGRVAEFGSVEVPRQFEVESYPTVHQLTSSVRARLRPGTTLVELFRALFPSGSVTGAPKRRTMEIIAALEDGPRGVYTGAVGMIAPEETIFNVPIRTLLLGRGGEVEMSVGSGVTWGSTAEAEYAECLQKAAFTRLARPTFSLLETMLFEPGIGFRLLDDHLARMRGSAEYFGYPFDEAKAMAALHARVGAATESRRVRLMLSAEGTFAVELTPLAQQPRPLRARLAGEPVYSRDPMLYHKTTFRDTYERRFAERPGYDEVLLRNEHDELTEFANGNLVLRMEGEDWTPPIDAGLLPGTLRARMLADGTLRERSLRVADLQRAEAVYRINSVRGKEEVQVEISVASSTVPAAL